MQKDEQITSLLKSLLDNTSDEFIVVDNWKLDLCAIGVTAPSSPQKLIYISTYNQPPNSFFVSLEAENRNDNKQFASVSFKELLKIINEFLGVRSKDLIN